MEKIQMAKETPEKKTTNAKERMCLARLGMISAEYPDHSFQILQEIQKKLIDGMDPTEMIAALIRQSKELTPDIYEWCTAFINQTYADLFDDDPVVISLEDYDQE